MAGFDTLPDYALKFHFTHHSPSGVSRPQCKEFFEKAIARPACVYDSMNCRMKAGIVCEQYAKDIVISNEDAGQAYRAAIAEFDQYKILEHDENDAARFATIRNDVYEIPLTKEEKKAKVKPITGTVLELTAKHTAAGLAEATAGANDINDGRQVSVYLEGVELPFIGEIDVEAGGVLRLKPSGLVTQKTSAAGTSTLYHQDQTSITLTRWRCTGSSLESSLKMCRSS